MSFMQIAAAGLAGYVIYRLVKRDEHSGRVAFADGETDGANFAKVRNAGPEAMRMDPPEWDRADEASDESFPASDPPATY